MSLDDLFKKTENWLHQGISENGIQIQELADSRNQLIEKCLDLIYRIHVVVKSTADSNTVDPAHDLIKISLHDMKTLNALLRIIVLYGIHPCLDKGVGIPISLRMKNPDQFVSVEYVNDEERAAQLDEIFAKLVKILKEAGDVADIIILGSYNSDLIAGAMQLSFKHAHRNKTEYFDYLKRKLDTYMLLTCLTSLHRRDAPDWFSRAVTRQLALIPVDFPANGVRSLIEFLTKSREKETLSLEDLERATKVLKAVPKDMDQMEYSKIVGKQFLQLLGSDPNGPLAYATVHIVSNIFNQKEQFISDGLLDPLISVFEPEDVTDDQTVEKSLLAITALLKGANEGILSVICNHLLTKLWLLFCFMVDTHRPSGIVRESIVSLINTSKDDKNIEYLINSLTGITAMFTGGNNGGVSVRKVTEKELVETDFDPLKRIQMAEKRVELFMTFLKDLDASVISKMFVFLLRKWISADESSVLLESDPFVMLANAKLVEKISQEQNSKLMKASTEIIEILCLVINDYTLKLEDSGRPKKSVFDITSRTENPDSDDEGDSDDEFDEEVEQTQRISICLDLVETFIAEKDILEEKDLQSLLRLRPSIDYLAENGTSNIKVRAIRVGELLNLTKASPEGQDNHDSRATYEKALSSLGDPLVPVRAHGLYLLRTLVEAKDEVLGDSPVKTLKIFLSQLKDDDSFVYLNAIKGISAITEFYGLKDDKNGILDILLGHYGDDQVDIDERLRTGEALLVIVQNKAKTFNRGQLAAIIDMLVSLSSVRQSAKNVNEYRIRMSAMSILGVVCELNALGVRPWLFDIVDCALGILTFERTGEETVLRRSAIVLIHSLAQGLPSLGENPIDQIRMVVNRLRQCRDTDIDGLVRNQAKDTIDLIEGKI